MRNLRAKMRHAARTELCHSVKKHAASWVARRHDSSVRDTEISLLWPCIQDAGVLQRFEVIHFNNDLTSAPTEPVAMRTINMQIRPGVLLDRVNIPESVGQH